MVSGDQNAIVCVHMESRTKAGINLVLSQNHPQNERIKTNHHVHGLSMYPLITCPPAVHTYRPQRTCILVNPRCCSSIIWNLESVVNRTVILNLLKSYPEKILHCLPRFNMLQQPASSRFDPETGLTSLHDALKGVQTSIPILGVKL